MSLDNLSKTYHKIMDYVFIGANESNLEAISQLIASGTNPHSIRLVDKIQEIEEFPEHKQEKIKEFDSLGVEINLGYLFTKILQKYGKYEMNLTEEYAKYNQQSIQDNIQKLKERQTAIRHEIKDAKHQNNFFKVEDLNTEANGIKYALRAYEPADIDKYYGRLILGLGKENYDFVKDIFSKNKKMLQYDPRNYEEIISEDGFKLNDAPDVYSLGAASARKTKSDEESIQMGIDFVNYLKKH